ncbi:phosphofructokinase domain-containing protein [Mycena leptocephala]|nr:phosphofructokinase domain-containing protein [Mycena leptocephala]
MKIAILTSGGDSAGMNAVVRSVVKAAILKGCEAWIVREGYEGLVRGNAEADSSSSTYVPPSVTHHSEFPPAAMNIINNLRFGDGELLKDGTGDYNSSGRTLKGRYIVRVGWDDVRGWFTEGGTLIGTARSKEFRTPEGRLAAAHNLIKEGIDALVVCGGDGSLTGADVFRAEWPQLIEDLRAQGKITEEKAKAHSHLKIVGLVGSIDNDMSMTDLTIGAPTALHRICEAIDNINSTAFSHSRAFVLEVMGRHCGWLALLAGVAGGADFLFIPEQPPKSQPWEDEMCAAIHQHREVGKRKTLVIVAEGAHDIDLNPIKAEYVKDILTERLGLDTRVTTLGHTQRGGRPCAMDRILPTLQASRRGCAFRGNPETPSYMIGIQENKITMVPLMEAVAMTKAVSTAIDERDFEKAMKLRDPEFRESLEGFVTTSALSQDKKLPVEKRMRIAIMHMGAPAGGMNAALELSWLRVDSWMARGGSELGTNPKFQQHSFHAMMMIGGFEAFNALQILEEGRKHYPAFHVPMVHLPATISNNVPMTEYSLGSDTSLNALVEACDAIKQSASASRNRVFVVETQGGKCGYIATMGALAVGACLVYTPEDGINLDLLKRDVRFLKARYKLDVKGKSEGRLVIRNEVASSVYTTEVITKMFKEEGGSCHTLQGGIPSPMDRARAVRLSLKCMAFVERQHELIQQQPPKSRVAGPETAAVITIQSSSIKWVPVQEMVQHADMVNRRGKTTWWADIKELVEALVARPQLAGLQARDLEEL